MTSINSKSNSDGMTTVRVTNDEVEALVNLNLREIILARIYLKDFGSDSELRRGEHASGRIRDFVKAGVISEERIGELNEQILVKEFKEGFRRVTLEIAENPRLTTLFEGINISMEMFILGIQDVLDKLIRSKKESNPDFKRKLPIFDESEV